MRQHRCLLPDYFGFGVVIHYISTLFGRTHGGLRYFYKNFFFLLPTYVIVTRIVYRLSVLHK